MIISVNENSRRHFHVKQRNEKNDFFKSFSTSMQVRCLDHFQFLRYRWCKICFKKIPKR